MKHIVELSCSSTSLVCANQLHTDAQYSAIESKMARAEILRAGGASAPHVEPTSLLGRLLHVLSM